MTCKTEHYGVNIPPINTQALLTVPREHYQAVISTESVLLAISTPGSSNGTGVRRVSSIWRWDQASEVYSAYVDPAGS